LTHAVYTRTNSSFHSHKPQVNYGGRAARVDEVTTTLRLGIRWSEFVMRTSS